MQNYKKRSNIVLNIKYIKDVDHTKWATPDPDVRTATVLDIKRNYIAYKCYLKSNIFRRQQSKDLFGISRVIY